MHRTACAHAQFLFRFDAQRPRQVMVMSGRSVHLTTLFLGKRDLAIKQYLVHILVLVTDNNPS